MSVSRSILRLGVNLLAIGIPRRLVSRLTQLQRNRAGPLVLGMIHVQALPGSPRNQLGVDEIVDKACEDASVYSDSGVDGVIVENMHDVPYVCRVPPHTTAYMSRVCGAVRSQLPDQLLVGTQILSAGHAEALAVASATGLDLIRCECFVFGHIADEGWMEACAGELLRYRRALGGAARDVNILTDIKKKHSSHQVTSDIDVVEAARAAEFFLSDGVIVTGSATAVPAVVQEVTDVKKAVKIPVLVGSGVTQANVHNYMDADAIIVGSHFKRDGLWSNDMDPTRVTQFMKRINELKTQKVAQI